MVSPVLIAAPVAILPAVAALWYLLKRYELYFDDARVFFSLVVGFFAGLLTTALEFLVFDFQSPKFVAQVGVGTAFLFFVVGYAMFETAGKLVVLGSKGYRTRKDTPYYGAALGLGMGSMMALGFIAINLNAVDAHSALAGAADNATGNATGGPGNAFAYRPATFMSMALVPLGAVFAHGATGVFVGRGTARGELWKAWLVGSLLQMPVLGIYWLFWPSIGRGDVLLLYPGLLSFGYGLALLHIARTKILDTIVPKHILDQVRRDRRREKRREEEE